MNRIVNQMALKSRVKDVTNEQIHSALREFLTLFSQYDSAKSIFLEHFSKPIKQKNY